MAQATKLIVTDRTLMRAKYGQPGWAKIRAARARASSRPIGVAASRPGWC